MTSQLPLQVVQRVLKLVIAYEGTEFRGFAAQREQRTVESCLRDVLESVLRTPVQLTCAGRTDSGVHAWGQVVSFAVAADVEAGVVARAVNGLLGGSREHLAHSGRVAVVRA